MCPSRVSYYASSQLTQVPLPSNYSTIKRISSFQFPNATQNNKQVYSLSTPARSIHSSMSNQKDKLRRIAVAPGTIFCQQLLQEGTYGRIYTGVIHHPLGENRDIMIKTVIDGASLSQVGYLLTEGSLLCGLSHLNILFPVAACTELPGPPQIAYPMPGKGNLKM